MSSRSATRIAGVDRMRVVANFSVVLTHWFLGHGEIGTPLYQFLWITLGNFVHYAVPFFFIVSGYFIRQSMDRGKLGRHLVARYAGRILPLFLFWTLFYLIAPYLGFRMLLTLDFSDLIAHAREVFSDPLVFIFTGGTHHLWFIISLIFGAVWLGFLRRAGLTKMAFLAGVGAYLAFLVTGPYRYFFAPYPLPYAVTRGLFLPMGCMAVGYAFKDRELKLTMSQALILVFLGAALTVGERLFLITTVNDHIGHPLMGALLIAAGVFFVALALPRGREKGLLLAISPLTLGIYGLHLFVARKVIKSGLFAYDSTFEFLGPFVVYAITIASVYALSKIPFMRRFTVN